MWCWSAASFLNASLAVHGFCWSSKRKPTMGVASNAGVASLTPQWRYQSIESPGWP